MVNHNWDIAYSYTLKRAIVHTRQYNEAGIALWTPECELVQFLLNECYNKGYVFPPERFNSEHIKTQIIDFIDKKGW